MPLTTSTYWPDLIDGQKARASDVELKFDWLEGNIWPMTGGEKTTGVYNIGHASYRWKTGFFGNLVIGGATITSDFNNVPDSWLAMYSTSGAYTLGSTDNISSVVETSTGAYTLNFTTPFQSSNSYAVSACGTGYVLVVNQSTASVKIEHRNYATDALAVPANMGIIIVGL